MKSSIVLIFFLLFSSLSDSSVQAQAPFWEQMKGPGGGMISSLVVTTNGHLFAARISEILSFGGVFRSTDNGGHWEESDSGLYHLQGPYGALQTDGFGNIFLVSDTDIFRSSDDGNHWSNINNGLPVHNIERMLVNSQSGNLYVFFDSIKYAGNTVMYRSTDHGTHWSSTSGQRFNIGSAAVDSSGNIFVFSYYKGAYRSSDEGSSWTKMAAFSIQDYSDGLAATKNGILLSTNSSARTIKRSTDNGASWQTVDTNVLTSYMGPPFISSKGTIFIGLSGTYLHTSRLIRSTDNGNTWVGLSGGLENLPFVEANSFIENTGGDIFVGLTQGVYLSSDNGEHWSSRNNELLLSTPSSIIEGANGHMFSATDYGQVFRSRDSGITWSLISDGITVIPIPRVIIFGSHGGIFGELALLKFAAVPNGHLFAATNTRNFLYRSVDEGDHWIPIDSSVYTRSIGVDNTGRIFTESYSINDTHEAIFRSIDDGDHWTKVSPPGGLDSLIGVSIVSNQAEHVFVAGYYFDRTSGVITGNAVYISTDHGDTWNPCGTEIAPYTINSLRTGAGKLVFIGTDSGGIFRSTDEGAHWSQVHRLFDSAVTSLAVHPDGSVFAGLIQRPLESYAGAIEGSADTLGGDVIISTDDGISWKSIESGIKDINENGISALAATSSGYIFAGVGYGKGGGIYRSFKPAHSGIKENKNSEAYWVKTIYPDGPSPLFEFSLPAATTAKLEIINETGEQIGVIASGYFSEGVHRIAWNTEKITPGVFFVRLIVENSSAITKVILVK